MSQPYRDWTLIEFHKYETYHYFIFKVTDAEDKTYLKGWVYAVAGTIWLTGENLDNLRSGLLTHGRQLS